MADMQNNALDIKSIKGYGIHGAIGLLMSIGFGTIIMFLFGFFISFIQFMPAFFYQGIHFGLIFLIIFVIYGAYTGYISGGNEGSEKYAKLGAIGGFVSGIAIASVLPWITIQFSGIFNYSLLIPLAVVGFLFGYPEVKKMLLLSASGIIGGAVAYGVYLSGENFVFYLNNAWSQGALPGLVLALVLFILAIGIAGASIPIGMHLIEKRSYIPAEIPGFLKITRYLGLVLSLIVLFVSSLMFLSMAYYANTSSSTHISGSEKVTIYVPVLLDEKGDFLKMYQAPTVGGDAVVSMLETEHGKALKISGSGEMDVFFMQKHGKLDRSQDATVKFLNGFSLSMSSITGFENLEGQAYNVWVYSEGEVRDFNFFITLDSGWGRSVSIHTEGPVKLMQGWQQVRVSSGSYMSD